MHVCCTIQVRCRSILLTTAASFYREWVELSSLKMLCSMLQIRLQGEKMFFAAGFPKLGREQHPNGSGVPPSKHE
jgi:hypothetical protein